MKNKITHNNQLFSSGGENDMDNLYHHETKEDRDEDGEARFCKDMIVLVIQTVKYSMNISVIINK